MSSSTSQDAVTLGQALHDALGERTLDTRDQLFLLKRLGEVVARTELHHLDRSAESLHAGQNNDRKIVPQRLDLLKDLDAIDVRYEQVEQH